MLRFHALVSTAAAALLVVPALTAGDESLASLQAAVLGTERALDVVRGIEGRLAAGEPGAAALVRSVTEAPIQGGPERDARLEALRQEVSLLQAELDVLESRRASAEGAVADTTPGDAGVPPAAGPDPLQAPVTTGLTPAQLEALRASMRPAGAPADAKPAVPTAAGAAGDPKAAAEGYSADPLRHAKACLRAGRYTEGFELVKSLEDPEARYLQARLLERLGRIEEAIQVLELAVDKLPAGYEAERAKSDLEFFRWKRDFLGRLPAPAKDPKEQKESDKR